MKAQVSLFPLGSNLGALLFLFNNIDHRDIHRITPVCQAGCDPYLEVIISATPELVEYLSSEFEYIQET